MVNVIRSIDQSCRSDNPATKDTRTKARFLLFNSLSLDKLKPNKEYNVVVVNYNPEAGLGADGYPYSLKNKSSSDGVYYGRSRSLECSITITMYSALYIKKSDWDGSLLFRVTPLSLEPEDKNTEIQLRTERHKYTWGVRFLV